MASWPRVDGCWAAGPFSTLKEDLGPLAATWSPGQRTADSGDLAGKLGVGADKQMHTAHAHCTLTAPQQSGPEGDGRWVELHGRRQGGG
jgi:hypothetical protein